MTRINVLACQLAIPQIRSAAERDQHVTDSFARIGAALADADVAIEMVVLPELSSIEYSRASFECLDILAEPDEGPSFERASEFAQRHRTTAMYGFARRDRRGTYISQGVVGPDGALIGCYDKLHLAQYGASMEKEFFVPGERLLSFDVGGITVAPIICYDMRFPALARALCVGRGAQLLVHCSAFYKDESYPSWASFVTARAMENQVSMLSLNRAGEGWGGTMICPPWCDEETPLRRLGTEEAFVHFTVDAEEIARVRTRYAFLRDRLTSYDLSG